MRSLPLPSHPPFAAAEQQSYGRMMLPVAGAEDTAVYLYSKLQQDRGR